MAGLGFAVTPPAAPQQPGATPRAPKLDPAGIDTARRAPVIDYKKSPLAAIGAVLQDVGRGLAGQPLFTEELRAQRQEQELLEFKKLDVGASALAKGMELLANTPAQNRERTAQQYGLLYEHLFPGFTETLTSAAEQPDATQAQLDALGEHGRALIGIAGSLEGALELAQKPEFIKQLDRQSDQRNAPEISQAFQRAQKLLSTSPQGNALLQRAAVDGWTLADLQDPQIQQALGLTQSHVNSIARDSELQKSLRPFGFVPTADADLQAKQAIGEKPLSRIAAEAAAKKSAEESAKIVPYVGTDGSIRREPQGMRNELAKMGFQPLATGSEAGATGQQKAIADKAAARVAGKAQGEKGLPVDPYFARIAEIDPETTVQEAIDQGLTPEIDDTTRRALQTAEAGTKNIIGLIGQARAVVAQNPDANTRVAALGGFVTNLKAEVEAFTRSTGIEVDFAREIAAHNDIWKQNGIDNALMKQFAISLAYMNAKNLDVSGRLSDSDVRYSAKALGAGASDPDILLNLLDQTELNADDTFRNNVEAITGARRPSQLPDVQTAEDIAERLHAGGKVTREESAALSPRARRHLDTLLDKPKARKKP